jgi:hypothetical protein
MATKIVTKNSSTASAVPTASDLVQGELAVNVADKRLFTEDNAGAIVELGTNPSTIDINAGTIDGTAIGASSASTGAFTTLTATGAFTSVGIDDNATSTAITIDSSENVGIGTSSPAYELDVKSSGEADIRIDSATGNDGALRFAENGTNVFTMYHDAANSALAFYDNANTSERLRIDSSGNVGIGTSSPNAVTNYTGLTLNNATYGGFIDIENNGTHTFRLLSNTTASYIGTIESDPLVFNTADTERMRIDSSGNLLVGKTAADGGVNGGEIRANGETYLTATSAQPLALNRKSTDGALLNFSKDGTTVGSIGNLDSDTIFIQGGNAFWGATFTTPQSGGNGLRMIDNGSTVRKFSPTLDNTYDLGGSSDRFDDIYATNGTIQTSDRNEKQDIAEISEAEQRVAVACKGLMRKFRWKDSVAEKGDDARIHFGIIAQDLQAAFEAEGLDAGDYAMFISTTWTDEETNEEKTRMGVRYSELLAFIISAI